MGRDCASERRSNPPLAEGGTPTAFKKLAKEALPDTRG